MLVPSMLNMADVMADSGYTEEDVFDCGISGQIVFLVVVPLLGACRVPVEALSHFMAGADDYTAEEMPEHWSGALSGKWTVKRDRLRILERSWNDFSDNCDKLAEAFDAASHPQATTPSPAPVVASGASDGVEPVTGKRWTPEKLAELKSYREKHGTKKAAEFFRISAQLIRQKLPSKKPQPKGYSAFTHRIK